MKRFLFIFVLSFFGLLSFLSFGQKAYACTNGVQLCKGFSYTGSGGSQYTPAAQFYTCVNGSWVLNGNCGSNYCAYTSSTKVQCVKSCTNISSSYSCSSSCSNVVPSGTNGYYCPGGGTCCSSSSSTTNPDLCKQAHGSCVSGNSLPTGCDFSNTNANTYCESSLNNPNAACCIPSTGNNSGNNNSNTNTNSNPSGCPVCPQDGDTYDSLSGKCLEPQYHDIGSGYTTYTEVDPTYETCASSGELCYPGCGCNNSHCPQASQISKGGLPTCLTTGHGCDTAIGTIDPTFGALVQKLFGVLLGLGGIIALVMIIISGYRLMVSQGNPESVKNAREQLTAAIVGLLFIIFALVILQTIGVDIIRLPGFSP